MFVKVFLLAIFAVAARAGLIGAPAAAVSYSSYASPLAAAPIGYAAPIAKVAAPISYAAPVAKLAVAAPIAKTVVAEEYDPNPQYSYGYDIQDGLTGDIKSQQESRSGDVVQGSYSLIDPDGTRRIVDYVADPINGFNAVVRKEPLAVKAVAKIAAPLALASPIAKIASPLAYASPVASVGLASPLGLGIASPVAKIASPLGIAAARYY